MICSQNDIAKRLDLSNCTVSKALRGDPIVARATRELVLATAAEMGYRNNPTLSAIAASRFRTTRKAVNEVIAFLHDARIPGQDKVCITAGSEHAERLGYSLQSFNVAEFQSATHLDRTLYSRGIRGLIFGTIFRAPFEFDLRWERYAVVGCETNVTPFPFDEVRVSWLAAVENALTIMAAEGFERIGFVFNSRISRHRDAMGQFAGVEGARRLTEFGDRLLPIFDWHEGDEKALSAYITKHSPDAFLVQSLDRHALLETIYQKRRRKIPPVAFVYMSPDNPSMKSMSGILANDRALGVQAVRQINSMLREGHFGKPANPIQTVVEHDFRHTDSLRKARRAAR